MLLGATVGAFGAAACGDDVFILPDDDDPRPDDPDDEDPEDLEGGHYQSPLVQQQELIGTAGNHLHVDEVRLRRDNNLLLQCSYTFAVVNATDPQKMRYQVQGLKHTVPADSRTPGCIHLASESGSNYVFTTHRGNLSNPPMLSGWDITNVLQNPASAVQLPVLQEPGISYEGVDVAGGIIYNAQKEDGVGIYTFESNVFTRIGTLSGLASAWGVRIRSADNTLFVVDSKDGLYTVDVSDPANPSILGWVATGGNPRGVALNGDIAYVAAGSVGVVVVDVSDLTNPTVVGGFDTAGSALRADYDEGILSVAAWNDGRVYDVSEDPINPRLVGVARVTEDDADIDDAYRPASTERVLGIANRGTDIFFGSWWLLKSFKAYPDRVAPNIRLPESVGMIDFGPVRRFYKKTEQIEVVNQGTAPLTITDSWVDSGPYTVTPRQMLLDPGESGYLTVEYTPTLTTTEPGYLQIASDDPAQPIRTAYLVGNQPGASVGIPLPFTQAVQLDGNEWDSSQVEGKVTLLAYFATF